MLDRMPRHRELQVGFKMLCEKFLTREGFLVMESGWKQKAVRGAQAGGVDFIVKRPAESVATVVECRFYRSRHTEPALIRNTLDEVRNAREIRNATSAILILTCDPGPSGREEAARLNIDIWDLAVLVPLAAKTPTLADTLYDLLREGDVVTGGRSLFGHALAVLEEMPSRTRNRAESARFIAELDQIAPGREGEWKFEQVCEKALRYLLSDQFQKWTTQVPSEGGLHRPELVARLVPRHDFWIALAEDFRSRYVLFFLRNDTELLCHGEVLSAASHLNAGAMRRIGIMVVRTGLDAGARRACLSLLRSDGKLILPITLSDLKDMLQAKGAGEEYGDILAERLHDMMTDFTA